MESRALLSVTGAAAVNGASTRIVSAFDGNLGNGDSNPPKISGNGRYVAFSSFATNLVGGDENNVSDIFVRDLQTGLVTRVSVSSGGVEGNSDSYNPSLSADGRYVVFESFASNLVANDTNQTPDIFLHDMQTGVTSRVSLGPNNEQGQSISTGPVISANGRYVAFYGASLNWLNIDSGYGQIWVRDLLANTTTLVSVGIGLQPGNGGDSFGPSLSDDGRYIAFYSNATNLNANDENGLSDVFVRDMQTGTTSLVSITTNGIQGNGSSFTPAISGNGSIIAFVSTSTNLVSGDTNNVQDVFVRNRLTNTTKRITVNTNGVQANGASREPAVNQDGSLILLRSYATNLDLSIVDSNNVSDVFLYRSATAAINLISKNSNGVLGNGTSSLPALDADGHRAVYLSTATNLDLSRNDSKVFADVFTVTIPNLPPVVVGFDTAVNYVENARPIRLDTDATVTDSDSPDFAGGQLTIKLTSHAQATDLLGIRTGGSGTTAVTIDQFGVDVGGFLIASFTGGAGTTPLVFSFNSSATPARVQTLLRAITFSNTSKNPSSSPRTVQVTLSDGDGGTSLAVSKTVNVAPVNDRPVIGAFDTGVTYKENAAPVLLDGNATVSDVDSPNFDTGKLAVSITSNKQSSDVLGIKTIGTGIAQVNVSGNQVFLGNVLLGTFTGGTNNAALVITLNANATPGRTQFLLRAITFSNTSENPSGSPRTVQVTLSDGDGGTSLAVSKTVNVAPVNDRPVIGAFDTGVTYKKSAAPVLLDSNATVSDVDSPNFDTGKLVVSITSNKQSSDVLGIKTIGTGTAQINVSGNQVFLGSVLLGTFSGGRNNSALVVTLNANATPGRTQFLLRAITFSNTSPNTTASSRTVQVTLSDGDGGTSLPVSKTVNII